jgi:hypothetical protein
LLWSGNIRIASEQLLKKVFRVIRYFPSFSISNARLSKLAWRLFSMKTLL